MNHLSAARLGHRLSLPLILAPARYLRFTGATRAAYHPVEHSMLQSATQLRVVQAGV